MNKILDTYLNTYTHNSIYDFDNNIILNWYSKRIIEQENSNQSVLELGLGHGYTAINFSNYFTKYVNLEGSEDVINNFKNNYPNYKFNIIQGYFENFNLNETFDLIVMGFVLEHVDDPVSILNYYKQYLKSTGRLFIAVPNSEAMNRRLGNLSGFLSDIEELSNHDLLSGHKRYFNLKSLKKLVMVSNYEIVNIEGIYLKPFTTTQIMSLNLHENIIESLCKLGINYPELSCGILIEVRIK